MKKIVGVLFVTGLFVVSSCGNSSEKATERANDLCDCAMDADIEFDGISNFHDFRQLEGQIAFVSRSSVESFSRRVVGQHACGTRNLGGPIASKRRSWCRTRSRSSRNRSKTLTAPALRHDH